MATGKQTLSDWARKPRFGFFHIVLYTFVLVFSCAMIGIVVLRQVPTHVMQQVDDFIAASPAPDVQIVPDPVEPTGDAYLREYEFTNDWFAWHVPVWDATLSSLKGKPDLRYLEIGLFEGGSALWMLENILTHPTARMTGVDIFGGPVKERYFANLNLSGAANKVTTIVDSSQVALRKLPLDSFDIVYIDGSHDENDVFEDAALSWRLLKEGGILIFDDYRVFRYASGQDDIHSPKLAIDAFFLSFKRHLEVIHNSRQLILRKKKS